MKKFGLPICKIPIEVKLNECSSDGVIFEPIFTSKENFTDLIKSKYTTKVTVVIEHTEPKNIEMTETEFLELIHIVDTYVNPVAELERIFKHKKYHKEEDS